jgi:8-oxo-dGTP pyrophosphatase MutT (NUDIX family)
MNRLLRLAYRIYRLHWHVTRPTTVGVRTMLIQDGQLLLVRHTYTNYWHFPGGLAKFGEPLPLAAQREAHEEAGVTITGELELLGMYWNFQEGKSDYIAVFVGAEFTIGPRLDRWEIADCRFFPLNALPTDLSPASAARVADYQRGAGPYVDQW